MNRYETAGIVADAIAGKHVLVIAATPSAVGRAFEAVAREAGSATRDIDRIYRANGREQIVALSGGSVAFMTALAAKLGAVRGRELDVVYLAGDCYVDLWEVRPALASRGGEVIR